MENEEVERAAAVPPEVWTSEKGINLVGIIVIALATFAGLDLIVMTAIYMNRGELPDIFGTLATIALSALAGVIGGAYASRSNA